MEKYSKEEKKIYKLKVDNIYVEMVYSQKRKSFNECIIELLKLKMK